MSRSTLPLALAAALPAQAALAQSACMSDDWLLKDDAAFARDCVEMAFEGTLEDRQLFAWMLFARINQLIDDPDGDGFSGSGKVPTWLAWPTDVDTFSEGGFAWDGTPRNAMKPSTEKADLELGRVTRADPDASNEEVTRNRLAYDYLRDQGLITKAGVAAFFETREAVDMPVGSVELKASWLRLPEGWAPREGALTFDFEGGRYSWRGIHIMVKMRALDAPDDIYFSEEPSWFWTTFQFGDDPGVARARELFITQRAPLPEAELAAFLEEAGMTGTLDFTPYQPNGTQIRFTVDGEGEVPVILGHTHMEDFAGWPNTAQPRYWQNWNASCHACHATASYNPETETFFRFTVPAGALDLTYNDHDTMGPSNYLAQGFKPLDFMWPIAFQAR